ncbi:MAG TPA: abscisic acid-deficient protein Aba4 family protein [Caldimonas sp.]|nr:abscisic acid-deficient protein Aba4 family protein [Caldimonas sp.]HEX2542632.1 abscisic acid-deficient protein Aba4 family protein [Caldimonas sp.]
MTASTLLPPDLVFRIANAVALVAWIALAASLWSARAAPTLRRLAGRAAPLAFALVYVLLFASHGMGGGGFDSLAAVQRLLSVPGLLVAGWLHYLAFDLFVGAWVAEQADALGLPRLLVLPVLALTFLFGPAGLLAFALLRFAASRRSAANAVPA